MPSGVLGPLRCYWREQGSGAQPALFLHCSLASSRALIPLMDRFETSHAMAAMDLPGHGRSDPPTPDGDMQLETAAAGAALIKQHMSAPVDLVGHSFGATSALRIAFNHPELIRTLVLYEPVSFGLLRHIVPEEYRAEQALSAPFDQALAEGDMIEAAAQFITRWGLPGEWERMPADRRQKMVARMWLIGRNNDSLMSQAGANLTPDELCQIKIPAMVMNGSDSPRVMRALRKALCDLLPKSTEHEVQTAGHMGPITHTDPVADIMQDFWQAHS